MDEAEVVDQLAAFIRLALFIKFLVINCLDPHTELRYTAYNCSTQPAFAGLNSYLYTIEREPLW